jgi:hypothetical protein
VVVSLAIHGAALAWAVGGDAPAPPQAHEARAEPVASPPAPGKDSEVLVVTLLDELAPRGPAGADSPEPAPADRAAPRVDRPRVGEAPARPSLATGRPPASETARPPTGQPGEPPRSGRPVLAMRRPELPQLPAEYELAAQGKPVDPGPGLPGVRARQELAEVRARLRDPRYVDHASPGAVMADRFTVVALADELAHQELRAQKDGTYSSEHETYATTVARDGTVTFHDKRNLRIEGLGGKFDVTDWMMRRQGIDPYASAKLRYLDRTRDDRVEIGRQYRAELLAQSAMLMEQHLREVWVTSPDVAARKQAVFELWDDCAETGDAQLVEGGRAARERLVRFVQVKLHGADAFTAEELARLNAHRRSRDVFDPTR